MRVFLFGFRCFFYKAVSVQIRFETKTQYSRKVCGLTICFWVQNPKDHIKTLFRGTHWIFYAVDKILFHYCSGDSREYNANFLQFDAFALDKVKYIAQAQ